MEPRLVTCCQLAERPGGLRWARLEPGSLEPDPPGPGTTGLGPPRPGPLGLGVLGMGPLAWARQCWLARAWLARAWLTRVGPTEAHQIAVAETARGAGRLPSTRLRSIAGWGAMKFSFFYIPSG
jgi:hypothetical protein